MSLTLQTVQNLAPDASSLAAAKKLLSPTKWSAHGFAKELDLIWAQCQGSGSTPYYTVVDLGDNGYKCTCPSRKFPCKHALALMMLYVADATPFVPSDTPTWVVDWLGRRRKTNKTATLAEKTDNSENVQNSDNSPSLADMITMGNAEPVLSAEELAKKQQAQAKRAEKTKADTDARISAGLVELQNWLQDQLRMGIMAFMDNASSKCRQISARLNDAKASTLASRIDELPAQLAECERANQPNLVIQAFGKWVLLCQAWFANPDDPDTRRAIATSETKDKILANDNAPKQTGIWHNVGEISEVRKDGLISHATWLVKMNDVNTTNNSPHFALLLDYHHPSTGQGHIGIGVGDFVVGELCFYPSRQPLRGFFIQQEIVSCEIDKTFSSLDDEPNHTISPTKNLLPPSLIYPIPSLSLFESYQQYLINLPWAEVMPYILTKGRVVKTHEKSNKQPYWWVGDDGTTVKLSNADLPKLTQATPISHAFILWDGLHGRLLGIASDEWGFLSC